MWWEKNSSNITENHHVEEFHRNHIHSDLCKQWWVFDGWFMVCHWQTSRNSCISNHIHVHHHMTHYRPQLCMQSVEIQIENREPCISFSVSAIFCAWLSSSVMLASDNFHARQTFMTPSSDDIVRLPTSIFVCKATTARTQYSLPNHHHVQVETLSKNIHHAVLSSGSKVNLKLFTEPSIFSRLYILCILAPAERRWKLKISQNCFIS